MPKKNWVFTINNYAEGDAPKDGVTEALFSYLVIGKEVGENGTPHLQCFVICKEPMKMAQMKGIFPRGHFEPAKKSEQTCAAYCKKGEQSHAEWEEYNVKGPNYGKNADYVEYGILPEYRAKGGKATQRKWDEIREFAKRNDLDAIDPDVFVKHYHSLKVIAKDYQKRPDDLEGVCGLWFYGPPNTGKSHKAREEAGTSWYDKPCNKWWDGYQGEKIVIIDDFDRNHKVLGHHLKRWTDRYSFPAESKGSTIQVRPEKVIVTSNYSIEEIFDDDPELAAALKRRFKVTHFHEKEWWKKKCPDAPKKPALKRPRINLIPDPPSKKLCLDGQKRLNQTHLEIVDTTVSSDSSSSESSLEDLFDM